jgi:succinoglycan biosynthesis transport protein ExoP
LSLKSNLLSAEAALEGTLARAASLRLQVSKQRKELDGLNARGFEIEGLHREARAAEQDYLLYRKKHEEARISVEMDKQKFINVTVAQPAQMPRAPEPRGLSSKMLLSVLFGLLGGVVLAFVLDTILDRSFTTAEDVEKRLGIPHIASIPDGEAVGF